MAEELAELEAMAKVAAFYGKEKGSRWWKQECKNISDKWRLKSKLEAGGGGVDQQPASRSRTNFEWVTDSHYGVQIDASD